MRERERKAYDQHQENKMAKTLAICDSQHGLWKQELSRNKNGTRQDQNKDKNKNNNIN